MASGRRRSAARGNYGFVAASAGVLSSWCSTPEVSWSSRSRMTWSERLPPAGSRKSNRIGNSRLTGDGQGPSTHGMRRPLPHAARQLAGDGEQQAVLPGTQSSTSVVLPRVVRPRPASSRPPQTGVEERTTRRVRLPRGQARGRRAGSSSPRRPARCVSTKSTSGNSSRCAVGQPAIPSSRVDLAHIVLVALSHPSSGLLALPRLISIGRGRENEVRGGSHQGAPTADHTSGVRVRLGAIGQPIGVLNSRRRDGYPRTPSWVIRGDQPSSPNRLRAAVLPLTRRSAQRRADPRDHRQVDSGVGVDGDSGAPAAVAACGPPPPAGVVTLPHLCGREPPRRLLVVAAQVEAQRTGRPAPGVSPLAPASGPGDSRSSRRT